MIESVLTVATDQYMAMLDERIDELAADIQRAREAGMSAGDCIVGAVRAMIDQFGGDPLELQVQAMFATTLCARIAWKLADGEKER